ncbi:MAG: hypothetical protein CVT63_00190, partial [Candidatus Anoxymicrobium japonicum]
TNGVSNANAATLLAYRAETTTVDVSDGTIDSTGNASYDLNLTVNPAALSDFVVDAPSNATTGHAFSATLTARDAYQNITTQVSGNTAITVNHGTVTPTSLAQGEFTDDGTWIGSITISGIKEKPVVTLSAENGGKTGSDASTVLGIPDDPSNIKVTPSGSASSPRITVTWFDNSAVESGYRVERRQGAGSWTQVGGNLPANTTSYVDSSVKSGSVYQYRVVAINGAGQSNDVSSDAVITDSARAASTWYLAEGTTAWGFSTYITIANPNNSECHAKITYMDPRPEAGRGRVAYRTVTLPSESQTIVDPKWDLGDVDFSTKVECLEGKAIAVDRTMFWNYGAGEEAHNSIGVTSPAKTWHLPEGSSAHNFETWTLVQNPNAIDATVTLTYMIEGASPKTFEKKIPAYSRATYLMSTDIGEADASIKVSSETPVIAERAMYRNSRREGHDSIGTTTPAIDYYLAEGSSAYGFSTYVLIQNSNATPTDVTVTYMTDSGPKPQALFSMPANSRKTIKVNDVPGMANTDFSTKVHGSAPIIAERAMYWDFGTGEACHDSVGMSSPHTTFYLPDGETQNGYETWTLVQNPNDSAVSIEVSYLKAGGGAVSLTETIPANSRKTYNMSDKIPGGRAAIKVTSKTTGKKIMVERAMYWNARGAGTDTMGGFSD